MLPNQSGNVEIVNKNLASMPTDGTLDDLYEVAGARVQLDPNSLPVVPDALNPESRMDLLHLTAPKGTYWELLVAVVVVILAPWVADRSTSRA